MLTVVFDEVRNTGGVTVEVFLNLVIANDELCSKNGLMSLSTSKNVHLLPRLNLTNACQADCGR